MKKIIMCIVCMLLLSGCTVKSNITVNYDGSVKEEVYVLNDNSYLKSEKYNFNELIDLMIKPYKEVLDFRKYSYTYEKGNKLSGAKVYKSYDNLCSYFGNSALNQYVYKYIDCSEDDYYYEIKNATEYIPYCADCINTPALDDIEYKISLPVAAEEQNADEVNGNTYVWKYDKDTKDKTFYLKISKSKLNDYEDEYKANEVKKQRKSKIIKVSITFLVLSTIFVIIIIFHKKYNKNKLDY